MSPVVLGLIVVLMVVVVYGIYKAIMGSWVVPAGIVIVALMLAFWVNFGGALAETQERTAFVEDIKVFENMIVLRDEDGEPWPFPFSVFGEELNEYVGKEHTVYYDPEAPFGRTFWLDVEVEE